MSLDLLENEMVNLNNRLKELADNETINVNEIVELKNLLIQKGLEVISLYNQAVTLMSGITPAPIEKKILQSNNGALEYKELIHRETSTTLASSNIVFPEDTFIRETDTKVVKISDGVTQYNKLAKVITGIVSSAAPDNTIGNDDDVWIKVP